MDKHTPGLVERASSFIDFLAVRIEQQLKEIYDKEDTLFNLRVEVEDLHTEMKRLQTLHNACREIVEESLSNPSAMCECKKPK